MTNRQISDTMNATNPVLTVAPIKEETEMLGATNRITALVVIGFSKQNPRYSRFVRFIGQTRIQAIGLKQQSPRCCISPKYWTAYMR